MRHELWPALSGLLVFVGLLASSGILLVVGSLVAVVWMTEPGYGSGTVLPKRVLRSSGRWGCRRAFIGDTVDYTLSRFTNDKAAAL